VASWRAIEARITRSACWRFTSCKLHGLHKYAHAPTVLAQPKWANKLTPRDLAAPSPPIWDHVNPYGRFELDMNNRLPLN
jgi:hypothetical protein